ncbi:zinc finger MYM-type protein 4 isoform X2 [Mugil cephalus]|uniref:zinc finger MYM-type protein 4 isoform X2 n=1 Tax=Mugil cephalus TaxID=48193 RepID=UPI001FB66D9A|nr:zinc finger MYM-type protein 4 isoform X2 [Mugil cephalus]
MQATSKLAFSFLATPACLHSVNASPFNIAGFNEATKGTGDRDHRVCGNCFSSCSIGGCRRPGDNCDSSLRLSEQKRGNNTAATNTEMETNEPKTADPVLPGPPSQTLTTDNRDHDADPGSTSESDQDNTEVKTEKEEETVTRRDNGLEKKTIQPEAGEHTDMDTASDCKTEFKDENVDTNEEDGAQKKEATPGQEVKVSAANDLDEMMDIGTVDQMEQEAQMKEEEELNSGTDVESSRSPVDSDWDAAEEKERRENEKKKGKRHKEVTPEELDNLEDEKDEINTKKTTRWAVKTLRDFLTQKNMDINFESYTATALNDILRLFYASVQSTKEGGQYSVASFRSLRAGINRHLREVNIIGDTAFKTSNAVFKAMLKRYRKSGKDTSFHHPRIPESELEQIRSSSALSPDTPLGLVRKVWFDIQLCLARRGREENRELTMTSFTIQRDEDGVEYVSLAHNPQTKNHKDPNDPHKKNLRGFMYARPDDPLCPVQSFKKYISKCPPEAKSFYLHPKRSVAVASDVWYSREPMGVHYLGDMLKKICEEVRLPRLYTNHSLRSTAVGRLSDAGLETRQIMSVTGHRCERSLEAHSAPSVQERPERSNILSSPNVPAISVSVGGDRNCLEEEADVKPSASDLMQSSLTPSSDAATNAGSDDSSPATMMNGMKVVKMSLPKHEKPNTCSVKSSPSPPLVKVKEEPVDEEYEQAVTSSTSTATVKDEPNTAKEDLRIGSVFSVPAASETQSLPIIHPSSLQMSCFHCKKSLIKGQTAFQRKGFSSLFCSTTCLTASLPAVKGVAKICHNCQKLILRAQDIILAPDNEGIVKEFCGQNCLTSFNYKENAKKFSPNYTKAAVVAKTAQPAAPQSLCSMCTRYCISKHEVILSGAVHKICSDACFNRFRAVNNLSMASCGNCGSYCHNKPLLLKMEGTSKTVCNTECLAKYKEKTKITQPCTMCRTTHMIADMVDSKNNDDSVNLFCSSSCVMAFKVQTVSASGARLVCDSCGKNTVPAYHLAMSDTTIRNFCTLPCVVAFQEKFKKSQKHLNIFTKLPIGSTQIQTVSPPQPQQEVKGKSQKLNCFQCASGITSKPELVQIKDKMVFLCSADCSHEFKRVNGVTSLCEYCKIEKITRDAKRINNKDCFFCSDGCKLLFRHELSKNWGKHCHSCAYCQSVSKKLVTAQYGGSTEEFCSEECRSRYTMLFCHVAKCDTCGRKGKLKQSLSMLGEVKHFCDLNCLLQFCSEKAASPQDVSKARAAEPTPVIANVISLAGPATGKSNASNNTTQQSSVATNSQSKTSGHISVQTEPVKDPHPPPAPKILKNKALMCRPLVQNKGISCKTQTVDVEAQTDDVFPKVMVVPVPVPVYVPVPMGMYSQCTPKPVGLPLPLPVPMFLPVTVNSAERIMETIQEIKQKIPSDPYEAELILMAEMVAEQEENNNKEVAPKEKETEEKEEEEEKVLERHEAPAAYDHLSNYSDDLDTDDLDTLLNNWEDPSSDTGHKSPSQPSAPKKPSPTVEVPVAEPSEASSQPKPRGPPPMDLEADLPVETLEKLAKEREQSLKPPSPPPATTRRRQAHRKARDKRGRKSQRLSKTSEAAALKASAKKPAAPPKLKSQYGVDAWKGWINWRQTQPDLGKPRFNSRPLELKEDVLRCTTTELSYGLCCFIHEVKRPNGESYSPDSLFYLCLGIQQYLFENGRVENIFMDRFYTKFSSEFTDMLRGFTPSVTASGYIHSRVEEEFLWDCKQLGAYSPIVLLNTLLFFCCKYFGFTTVEQHRQLSFAHVMRCTKANQNGTKTTFLRFYPPISPEPEPEVVAAKRRREEESKEDILEMGENKDNPLRCPVRLYEFYLSKCSESVKQRTNLFYLHPERCCVPNSPLWFSSTPLDDGTMEAMLTRILTVRELHVGRTKGGKAASDDPPFVPDEEENEDSE